ncbi:MAG: glycoside hydrolase family 88 protein [Salinivirgaceae bacterium]|jgi:rhamnogalacturonyl hydrolase YesR|nr:glycoside hydrolase family 88 protein [Salinivirgaceae bacterium]
MKPTQTLIAFLFLSFLLFHNAFSQSESIKWSDSVAQSFIKRFPDPDTMYCCGGTNHFSWQAGYVMFAMEKIWKSTGDSTYFNYIKRYVDQQVDAQGNVPPFKDDALDNFLPGYAILFMYEQTQEEKYKIAAKTIRDGFNDYPRNSNDLFWHGEWSTHQSWIDGVFMGQIFLARYGSIIGDSKYAFDEVVKQMTLIVDKCGQDDGLIMHGWDESKKASWADKTTGLAPAVWSEGLGWYAVLIADVFDYLPKDHQGYPKLKEIHKHLCEGIKANQDPETGMWCQVVDKCGDPGNWNETSGSCMFTYLLQNSIDKGYISEADYGPVVKKAYKGFVKKAVYNEEGFIDLLDCSSIGIVDNYDAYLNSPKEVSPFGAFGSFIIATNVIENSNH